MTEIDTRRLRFKQQASLAFTNAEVKDLLDALEHAEARIGELEARLKATYEISDKRLQDLERALARRDALRARLDAVEKK